MSEDARVRAIGAIPGVGRMTATAAVVTIGDAETFKSGVNSLRHWVLCRARSVQVEERPSPGSAIRSRRRRCLPHLLLSAIRLAPFRLRREW